MHRERSNFNVTTHTVNMIILCCMANHDLVHSYTTSAGTKIFVYTLLLQRSHIRKKSYILGLGLS